MYTDVQGHPRMRYGTEVESTRSQLRTASKLGITQVRNATRFQIVLSDKTRWFIKTGSGQTYGKLSRKGVSFAQVGFWTFNSCDKEMGKATIDWVTGGGEGGEE
eukprot:COSAG06_NODE_8337_length_2199_cov_176.033072_2_plen_104_part_00